MVSNGVEAGDVQQVVIRELDTKDHVVIWEQDTEVNECHELPYVVLSKICIRKTRD